MAQTTSELWKRLYDTPGTRTEYSFMFSPPGFQFPVNPRYGSESVVSHSVERELYSQFGIGNAATATLKLTLFIDNVQRGAKIWRYVRLVNGEEATEWLPAGVFFANRRTEEDGLWTIEAFDAMRMAEAVWKADAFLRFPMSMSAAAGELAKAMGCRIDPRTQLSDAYTIDHPANEYTIRQVLQYIAAAHGGNWIVTGAGELLLVPLGSAPEETNYLVTERGQAITLGGVRLLVG